MVMYSLADSAGDTFSIEKSSGILILEQSLDREVQSTFQLTVKAFDLGSPWPLSSSVNITIIVLDINDNPPVFEHRDQLATVPEDVRVGTEVLSVHAASKDIGTNAEITYGIRSGNEHRKFHIHPLTGKYIEKRKNHLCGLQSGLLSWCSVCLLLAVKIHIKLSSLSQLFLNRV